MDAKGKTEQDFVEVKVRVELPKKVNDFLEDFARFIGVSVEDIFRNEIESVVENFHTGGFYDAWTTIAFKKRGIGKELGYGDC